MKKICLRFDFAHFDHNYCQKTIEWNGIDRQKIKQTHAGIHLYLYFIHSLSHLFKIQVQSRQV